MAFEEIKIPKLFVGSTLREKRSCLGAGRRSKKKMKNLTEREQFTTNQRSLPGKEGPKKGHLEESATGQAKGVYAKRSRKNLVRAAQKKA